MIQRYLQPALQRAAAHYPVVCLTGPRQSGKTTLVRALWPEKRYASLEDPDQFDFARTDPRGFLEQGGIGGIILDEAQRLPSLFNYLQGYAAKHQAAGNGFGFGLVRPKKDVYTRTLSARYYKDGSEILIDRGKGKRPRRLTPRECARLMGFPDTFKIPVSDTQAYKQFGNSVVVPVMAEVARIMKPRILELKEREESGVTQPRLKAA